MGAKPISRVFPQRVTHSTLPMIQTTATLGVMSVGKELVTAPEAALGFDD